MALIGGLGLAVTTVLLGAAAHAQVAPVEVELAATPIATVVEGTVTVRLRVRLDADASLVQLSAARLDVAVQIAAPWADGTASAPLVADAAAPADGVSIALNGGRATLVEREPVERDGRRWRVLELERTVMPLEAGALVLTAEAGFATASAFEENLFGERMPLDRVAGRAAAEPVEISVAPWPAEDRPPSFQGAVGTFSLAARADFGARERLEVGDTFDLVVDLTGEGNLARLTAPRVDPAGFHVRGWIERAPPAAHTRTFQYELELTDGGISALPPIPYGYLDPTTSPPAYRELTTDPQPFPGRASDGTSRSRPWLFAGIGAALAAVAAAWVVRRRRRITA